MGLILLKETLKSQIIKKARIEKLGGIRTINLKNTASGKPTNSENPITGALVQFTSWIWDKAKTWGGFLISSAVNFLQMDLSSLFSTLVQQYFFLKTFDWNQSDAEIEKKIAENNKNLIDMSGSLLGNALGHGAVFLATCAVGGIGKAVAAKSLGQVLKIPVINSRVALALGQESGEELKSGLKAFLSQTYNVQMQNLTLRVILGARQWGFFGMHPINVSGLPPDTFVKRQEAMIERLPQDWQKFTENFIEGLEEGIIEAGYILTSLDVESAYAATRLASRQSLGKERAVRLKPDKNSNEEIVIQAPQAQIIPEIRETIRHSSMLANRDIGQWVGMPLDENLRASFQRRKLMVVFMSRKAKPWTDPRTGERAKTAMYSIPDVKTGLSWGRIKTAMGGVNGYNWGKFRCNAQLSNGRSMHVYGASAGEAESMLRSLHSLCDPSVNILQISITEEKDRAIVRKKKPMKMYPAYCTLLVRRNSTDDLGRSDMKGNLYDEKKIRLDLWHDTEPKGIPPLP